MFAIQNSGGHALINGFFQVKVYATRELAEATLAELQENRHDEFKYSEVREVHLVEEVK